MGRGGRKKTARPPGELDDAQGFAALAAEHLEWMRVVNYAAMTVVHREKDIRHFADWCKERGLLRPSEVTRPVVERYQRWLFHYRKANGKPLGVFTQYCRLDAVRAFFKWLAKNHHLLYSPAAELEMPRQEKRLPKFVLSVSEAEAILARPEVGTALGLRDRAILEALYSTGIRRFELCSLTVFAIDAERGTLMVRQGKGKKDRMVPIGNRAVAWVEKYVADVRADFVTGQDEGWLFLNADGLPLAPDYLTHLVKQYVDASGIGKRGSCHLFRHSMATLMLENGADLRFIQAMLGHADITATQLYTHVSIRKLKEVHTLTHPGAKLGRGAAGIGEGAVATGAGEQQEVEAERPATREQLLSALASEAAEEEV